MSKAIKSDSFSLVNSPLMSRAPYMTSSGHIRYTNKARLNELPIDFSAWVAIFEQESTKTPVWIIDQLSIF